MSHLGVTKIWSLMTWWYDSTQKTDCRTKCKGVQEANQLICFPPPKKEKKSSLLFTPLCSAGAKRDFIPACALSTWVLAKCQSATPVQTIWTMGPHKYNKELIYSHSHLGTQCPICTKLLSRGRNVFECDLLSELKACLIHHSSTDLGFLWFFPSVYFISPFASFFTFSLLFTLFSCFLWCPSWGLIILTLNPFFKFSSTNILERCCWVHDY